MIEEIISGAVAEMGLSIADSAPSDFAEYARLLEEQNRVMNLTSITGDENIAKLHFIDSLSPLLLFPMKGKTVIDVGTGAGFPGLPLRIAVPEIRLTLLDSLQKRIGFLQSVCSALNYDDVECIHARAEECGERREGYDYAVSRAVARLNVLCELCLPYVRAGGAFLALKGPALAEELDEAERVIKLLGGELERVFEYSVPGTELRHSIAVIRKVSATPKKYPRRFALIKKSPL